MSKRRASLQDRPITPAASPRTTDDLLLGAERARQTVEEIPLREIMPNRMQPRTQPSQGGLEELAASIRQHGVLEPIIVRAIPLTLYEGTGRRYELVAGERRWRASGLAEHTTISAIVLVGTTDDRAMLELAITENLQREDLHPLDEAMAFGRMQTELGYSYAQIAERLGKSKGYVQNRMRLLQLEDDLQQLVAERPDTLAHVYEIARVPDQQARSALIAAVRDDALSRAATRARVQTLLQPEAAPLPSSDDPYFQKYDRELDQEEGLTAPADQTEGSYFQKYDREAGNKDQPASASPSGSPDPTRHRDDTPGESVRLTSAERSILKVIQTKVERLLDDPAMLTPEDWAILSTLGLRLSDLLRKVGQAHHDQAREEHA